MTNQTLNARWQRAEKLADKAVKAFRDNPTRENCAKWQQACEKVKACFAEYNAKYNSLCKT